MVEDTRDPNLSELVCAHITSFRRSEDALKMAMPLRWQCPARAPGVLVNKATRNDRQHGEFFHLHFWIQVSTGTALRTSLTDNHLL